MTSPRPPPSSARPASTPSAPRWPTRPTPGRLSPAGLPQEPAREEASDGRDAVQAPASPKITASQQRKLFALFKAKGITEEEQLPGIVHVIGRPIESCTAMTPDEFEAVVKPARSP